MSTPELIARCLVAAAFGVAICALVLGLATTLSDDAPVEDEETFRCASCRRVVPILEAAPDVEGVDVWCQTCADVDDDDDGDDDFDPPGMSRRAA